MTRLRAMVHELHALELVRLERADEAFDELSALRRAAADMPPCDRAGVELNAAYAALRMARPLPSPGSPDDPRAALDRARSLDEGRCARPARVRMALENRAWIALRDGDPELAERALDGARRAEPRPPAFGLAEQADIAGRIALASKRWREARDAFEEEARLAPMAGDGESAWRADEGRAKALAALGRRTDALAALDRAESLLDRSSRLVPLGEGREAYLGQGDDVTAQRVMLLLDLGDDAAALRAIRGASARSLRGIERDVRLARLDGERRGRWDAAVAAYWAERDAIEREGEEAWRLPHDRAASARDARASRAASARAAFEAALAEALPGEADVTSAGEPGARDAGALTLAFFEARGERVIFADAGARVRAVRASGGSTTWLAPLRAAIEAAARIDVVAYGSARAIDVHALPLDGEPLVARVPVVYRLDLAGDGVPDKRDGRALVVGDPTMDLGASRVETQRVAAALRARAFQVDVLTGDDATAGAVRDAIGRAALFHYAGHGAFAGRDGWSSALPLASSSELSVEDVLALPRVPPRVLLFGCETARSGASAFEGLGIAHAFLVAGAREVVAAARRIDDAVAGAVSAELHAHLARGEPLPAALRAAELAVRARDPQADWAALRVIAR